MFMTLIRATGTHDSLLYQPMGARMKMAEGMAQTHIWAALTCC